MITMTVQKPEGEGNGTAERGGGGSSQDRKTSLLHPPTHATRCDRENGTIGWVNTRTRLQTARQMSPKSSLTSPYPPTCYAMVGPKTPPPPRRPQSVGGGEAANATRSKCAELGREAHGSSRQKRSRRLGQLLPGPVPLEGRPRPSFARTGTNHDNSMS